MKHIEKATAGGNDLWRKGWRRLGFQKSFSVRLVEEEGVKHGRTSLAGKEIRD